MRTPNRQQPVATRVGVLERARLPLLSGSREAHGGEVAFCVDDVEVTNAGERLRFARLRFEIIHVDALRKCVQAKHLHIKTIKNSYG